MCMCITQAEFDIKYAYRDDLDEFCCPLNDESDCDCDCDCCCDCCGCDHDHDGPTTTNPTTPSDATIGLVSDVANSDVS